MFFKFLSATSKLWLAPSLITIYILSIAQTTPINNAAQIKSLAENFMQFAELPFTPDNLHYYAQNSGNEAGSRRQARHLRLLRRRHRDRHLTEADYQQNTQFVPAAEHLGLRRLLNPLKPSIFGTDFAPAPEQHHASNVVVQQPFNGLRQAPGFAGSNVGNELHRNSNADFQTVSNGLQSTAGSFADSNANRFQLPLHGATNNNFQQSTVGLQTPNTHLQSFSPIRPTYAGFQPATDAFIGSNAGTNQSPTLQHGFQQTPSGFQQQVPNTLVGSNAASFPESLQAPANAFVGTPIGPFQSPPLEAPNTDFQYLPSVKPASQQATNFQQMPNGFIGPNTELLQTSAEHETFNWHSRNTSKRAENENGKTSHVVPEDTGKKLTTLQQPTIDLDKAAANSAKVDSAKKLQNHKDSNREKAWIWDIKSTQVNTSATHADAQPKSLYKTLEATKTPMETVRLPQTISDRGLFDVPVKCQGGSELRGGRCRNSA